MYKAIKKTVVKPERSSAVRLLGLFLALFLVSAEPVSAEKLDWPKLKKDLLEKWEEDGKMFADLKLFLVGSRLLGSSNILGAEGDAVLAPTFKLGDQLHFVGLYNGYYARKKQVYVEDRGNWVSSESMSHNFSPSLRYKHDDDLSFNLSVFKLINLSKETLDEEWYNGLYDYQDIGFGLDSTYNFDADGTLGRRVNVRLQYYTREYPQYISLFTLASLGNIEEKEKDYKGLLLLARITEKKDKTLSYSYELSRLSKSYTDKKVETDTWERESNYQKDTVLTHTATVSTLLPEGISLSLNASYTTNTSNQNLAQGSFATGTFHKNYYAYTGYQLAPSVRFVYRHPELKPIKVSFRYSLQDTKYEDRYAKNSAGTLMTEKQRDLSNTVSAVAIYPIKEHINAGVGLEYIKSESNNDYESFYRYDYEIFNISAGVMYHY